MPRGRRVSTLMGGFALPCLAWLCFSSNRTFAQVYRFEENFNNLSIPYNAPNGEVRSFQVAPGGIITQFWWGFSSTGWRNLHIRYTLPSGYYFEQLAGAPWVDCSPVWGSEAGGTWQLRITEFTPGSTHILSTSIGCCYVRHARTDLPVAGNNVPSLSGLDPIVLSWMRSNEFEAATLAVMRNNRLVYRRGYGWQDFDRNIPISPDAVMRLASNTKPITSWAIHQLVRDGRLSYSAKVYDLLAMPPLSGHPIVDARVRDITIQHLLDHAAGFPHDAPNSYDLATALGWTRVPMFNEVIAYMWNLTLAFTPGTSTSYSNYGYQLLGAVIEKVTGMNYDQYIRTVLTPPLGISTMRVGQPGESQGFPNEIWYAGHYFAYPDTCLTRNDWMAYGVPEPYAMTDMVSRPGAGSLISSASDYCRYLRAYLHPGDPKPPSLIGWTWGYVFYGSLPGTWTITEDQITPDGNSITYVFLTNERDGPAAIEDLRSQISTCLNSVTNWPSINLFTDVNSDGHVDVIDLLYLVDAFGSYTGDANYDPACDFNGDGAVDVLDLLDMIENFGKY